MRCSEALRAAARQASRRPQRSSVQLTARSWDATRGHWYALFRLICTPARSRLLATAEDPRVRRTTQMHTMAAYFPDKPTGVQREAVTSFIRALGALYPCSHCAEDFRVALDERPPRCGRPAATMRPHAPVADPCHRVCGCSTSSRSELCVWMCEAHNRVNRDLGKEEFSCELKQLDARWCVFHSSRMMPSSRNSRPRAVPLSSCIQARWWRTVRRRCWLKWAIDICMKFNSLDTLTLEKRTLSPRHFFATTVMVNTTSVHAGIYTVLAPREITTGYHASNPIARDYLRDRCTYLSWPHVHRSALLLVRGHWMPAKLSMAPCLLNGRVRPLALRSLGSLASRGTSRTATHATPLQLQGQAAESKRHCRKTRCHAWQLNSGCRLLLGLSPVSCCWVTMSWQPEAEVLLRLARLACCCRVALTCRCWVAQAASQPCRPPWAWLELWRAASASSWARFVR